MKLLSLRSWAGLVRLSCISLACSGQLVSASDVKSYVVEKGIQYVQSSASAPVPDDNNGLSFDAVVKSTGSNLVTSVTLTAPNGTPSPIPQDASDEFKVKRKYTKPANWEAAFPEGNYTLTINTV